MSAELGVSIAGVSIELILATVSILSLILAIFNSSILVLQSFLDRHKVHRFVISRDTQNIKKEEKLIDKLSRVISESGSGGRRSTPERDEESM
jgi:hypothetical protein